MRFCLIVKVNPVLMELCGLLWKKTIFFMENWFWKKFEGRFGSSEKTQIQSWFDLFSIPSVIANSIIHKFSKLILCNFKHQSNQVNSSFNCKIHRSINITLTKNLILSFTVTPNHQNNYVQKISKKIKLKKSSDSADFVFFNFNKNRYNYWNYFLMILALINLKKIWRRDMKSILIWMNLLQIIKKKLIKESGSDGNFFHD